jgi:hypothetical protein
LNLSGGPLKDLSTSKDSQKVETHIDVLKEPLQGPPEELLETYFSDVSPFLLRDTTDKKRLRVKSNPSNNKPLTPAKDFMLETKPSKRLDVKSQEGVTNRLAQP